MVPGTLPTPARYVRTRLFKNLQAILAWNYRVNLNINISTFQHITRHQRFYVFRVKCLGYFGPIRIRFFWGKIISILSELLSTTPQISFQFHYQPFTPPCLGGSTGAAKINIPEKFSKSLCLLQIDPSVTTLARVTVCSIVELFIFAAATTPVLMIHATIL